MVVSALDADINRCPSAIIPQAAAPVQFAQESAIPLVLGVPSNESSTGIRRAFRELALRYHPDRAGGQGTSFFQEIIEAYRVLSDPERRSSYDEGLRHGDVELSARPPMRPAARYQPEPLVPAELSLFRDFEVTQPSAAEVFEHILRSFTERELPKSRHLDALDLELLLSADEASRGGVVQIGMPVFYPCRVCHGAGTLGATLCNACGGRGMAEEEEQVRLAIPAFVRDGSVLRVPLRGLGIHNMYLQVAVHVGD
jgi:molecular chaperone DnaJ